MVSSTTPAPAATSHGSLAPMAAHAERLAAGAPLSVARQACLRLRTRLASCRACADACPSRVLAADERQLALVGDCSGCGRCQAACPTGALLADGFAAEPVPVAGVKPLTLDCWQVPRAAPGAGQLRVPCLGGLSAARLLAYCVSADARPVVLADRGACAACASGGADHPARAMVERVSGWMTEAGVPSALLPRIKPVAASDALAQRPRGDAMLMRGRTRRGFFAALTRAAPQPASEVAARRDLAVLLSPASERGQTIAALRTLVARHGGRMPAALFHRLETDGSCCDQRVCAAVCPTGSLVRYRDEATRKAGIAHDSASCLGCGHCTAVCPQRALRLHAGQGDVTSSGHRPLTGLMQHACCDCGSWFAQQDGERCGRCRTSAQLARSAFKTLFAARP